MESDERRIMGIADAFGREDRFEIKTESFIRMAQEAAAAEANLRAVVNMVNCNVPHRYIREMLTGNSEDPDVAENVDDVELVEAQADGLKWEE